MPELPDVAGFQRYLDATSLHQRIASASCHDPRFVKGVSRRALQRRLKGAELVATRRWGKWLFAPLSTGGALVLHFGMTGGLDYAAAGDDEPRHTRLVLHFANGYRLAVISQRMIGRASITDDVDAFAAEHDLGPDALSDGLDRSSFVERLSGRRGAIKSALMNQAVVAGIGNVYADEMLFQAKLHPATAVTDLDADRLGELYTVMRRVLRVAARKGGNGEQAPRGWVLRRRGAEETCPRCGGRLDSIKVNGRTSWFCPACQAKG
ncbi:MAG: Fpg/Nei family DNA glycosylase [Planctomycetota bacterium]